MISLSLGFKVLRPCKRFYFSPIKSCSGEPNSELKGINRNSTQLFSDLGLNGDLVKTLNLFGIKIPTSVQKMTIPHLIDRENIVMAAQTGSGKTLAYVLPIVQSLNKQEKEFHYQRKPKRPRCLVLAPTRELSDQILKQVKNISHHFKIASAGIYGGESYTIQKKSLDRPVDIVVGSPQRINQHREQGNLYFSEVNTIVIDEVDTMLLQGFGSDIRKILQSVSSNKASSMENEAHSQNKLQLIMATATLTNAVKKLLGDLGGFSIDLSSRTSAASTTEAAHSANKNRGHSPDSTQKHINMKLVEIDGLHKPLKNVKHEFINAINRDKLTALKDILVQYRKKNFKTLIFCNTVKSAQAIQLSLDEMFSQERYYSIDGTGNFHSIAYHGDLPSSLREEHLERFRKGDERYMVCTDMAARGLDIPDVQHVILFDFPLNPIDYIHRSGRCGRAGRFGVVSSILVKRDLVLSHAIQAAIRKNLPIDTLTSARKDYQSKGKLFHLVSGPSTKVSEMGVTNALSDNAFVQFHKAQTKKPIFKRSVPISSHRQISKKKPNSSSNSSSSSSKSNRSKSSSSSSRSKSGSSISKSIVKTRGSSKAKALKPFSRKGALRK